MALWNLLLRFALLKQQVVALHHHLVAGLKPFDNFSSTVALYPHVHPSLHIAAAFAIEANCSAPSILLRPLVDLSYSTLVGSEVPGPDLHFPADLRRAV